MEPEELNEIWNRCEDFDSLSWDITKEMSLRDQIAYTYHIDTIKAMILEKYGERKD